MAIDLCPDNQDGQRGGRHLPRRGCTHDGEGPTKVDARSSTQAQRTGGTVNAHQPATAIPPHVLERADMQDALARHDFGAVFALARKWAGISYSRIAEACAIKPERVGTLARGMGSITTYEKITLIADALPIPGHMLGLAPRG